MSPLRIELSPIVLQTIVRTSYTIDPIAEGVRIELTKGILTVCCPADRRTFILGFKPTIYRVVIYCIIQLYYMDNCADGNTRSHVHGFGDHFPTLGHLLLRSITVTLRFL